MQTYSSTCIYNWFIDWYMDWIFEMLWVYNFDTKLHILHLRYRIDWKPLNLMIGIIVYENDSEWRQSVSLWYY